MNPEEIVKKFFDRWNAYDVDGAVALLDSEVVASNPFALQRKIGKEGVRKGIEAYNKAFPDLKMEITMIVAHGGIVALEEVETATFKGPFEVATVTIPPTNRSYELRVACFFRVNVEGLIAEMRNYWDTRVFFEQLGIDPESFSKVIISM
ncbi:MAG TPA: nuclear transport factor 2 family protein [Candidatus Acidoferrales bacterium]|nr:nuclear transport factor 2 family protein [Candidatus Acidoferrales bacterium]